VESVVATADTVTAQIESLRSAVLDNLVIAGPTNGDDYGYTPMSDDEFYSFIYGEECTTSNQPAASCNLSTSSYEELYNIAVCVLGAGKAPQSAVGQAAAGNIQPNQNNMLVVPKSVNTVVVNKKPYSPAKAFTKHYHPMPEQFYAMETGRIPFKSVNDKGTYRFVGAEGTIYLMQNKTGKNYSVFSKNSHIRVYKTQDGVERSFINYLQLLLDESVKEVNEAFDEFVAEAVNEGECYEVAVETAIEVLGQPIKYIVLEATGTKNEEGGYDYDWNYEAVEAVEQEYQARGYSVIGIQSSLLLSNISIDNFRLNGNAPCVVVGPSDIRALNVQGISEWTIDNIHQAVKPVTDLGAWLDSVMPNVNSISFSFNGITPFQKRESVVGGNEAVVHEYSLTTDPQYYEQLDIEVGSVPAWTINLWTAAPVKESIVPHAKAIEVAAQARVVETKTAKVNISQGMSATSLLKMKLDMQAKANAQKVIVDPLTGRKVNGRPAVPTPANQARRPVVQVDTVPAAMNDNDSMPGMDDELELSPVAFTSKPTPSVVVTTVMVAVTEESDTAAAVNNSLNALSSDDSDDLCQVIKLKDIPMTANYLTSLTEFCTELGLTIAVLPAGDKLGSYSNEVISIVPCLSDNHRAQVLLHELVHAVFSSIDPATVEAICNDWLANVGHSDVEPAGVNLEEQFAYSFMSYAHDTDTLVAFLRALAQGADTWEAYYDALGTAAMNPASVVADAAPIAIITETKKVTALPANNPVLNALLNAENQSVLVLTDEKGNLPRVYNEAFPELSVPQLALGQVAIIHAACGLVIYAVCAVTEQATLRPDALKDGLDSIADSDTVFLCEADLGFGMGITHTPYILGAVRQALGQAKVKTISLPAMERLTQEWKAAGAVVTYPLCDLSLWPSALMKGTAIVAVPVGSTNDVFHGMPDSVTVSTVYATMAILNEDATINASALAEGLVELEGYISGGDIPLPIYCYSCQLEAFKDISAGVTAVQYAKSTFLDSVKLGVLAESPIKGEELNAWYYYLLEAMDGEAGGMLQAAEFSQQLYGKAFEAVGLPVELAAYALSPLPLSWLQHGLILVVAGKNARGLIDRSVAFEELISKGLLEVLVDRGVKVYTAKHGYDKDAKRTVTKGIAATVHGIELSPLPEGMEGEDMLTMKANAVEYVNGNVVGPEKGISTMTTFTLDQYMQKHLLDTIQYLVDTQGVEVALSYMQALLPNVADKITTTKEGKVRYRLSVYNLDNRAEYYMEFTPSVTNPSKLSARHCTISSGNADRDVNAITNLKGFPDAIYDGVTVAIGLAISAASGRKLTQDTLEGYLAGTTNLWARSENYGLELTTVQTPNYSLTDSLKVIIDNSGKTISSTPNQVVDSKGVALGHETKARWPYHMPCNAGLDLSVMASLMQKGELVLCDKYAMERIVIGDGARAMLASILSAEDAAKLYAYNDTFGLEIALNPLNGQAVYTVCWPTDKASKALNRPSQFHGASQADGWKDDVRLTWCPLHTVLGEGKRSAVRGFKQTFIATNDFLSQGSGAASQHPDASVWSFKVNGSMRATLDWHQVPAVQEALDASGNHKAGLRCHKSIMGPDVMSGPSGKDSDGKELPATKWFCETFAQKYIVPTIEAAMYTDSSKKEHRIYRPDEEMVVLFDKAPRIQGVEVEGFYPTGNTTGLPAARTTLFSNNLGKQNCIITGYRILSLQRGERLQVVLEYATVMDTRDHSSEWSGAKARGLGIKFIISHDGSIDYLGNTAPHNGVDTSLDELYKAGAIHVTPEGLKGNYAFMQGFAAAHGNAHESGPYLCIDQYLMDGSINRHYVDGDARMVSDMTDTTSYFYEWVRSITRTVRMKKTLNEDVWHYIKACNKGAMDKHGRLPGLTVTKAPNAIQWDAVDANGEQLVDDVRTVTIEYDVQVGVFDYWVQVEVAPPGACTGNQGMTAEQASNLEVMLKYLAIKLWNQGYNSRKGVENAVESARVHAQIEAGNHVPGVFTFNPKNKSHNDLMEHLLYQVSATGARTLRPAKDFYVLLAAIFGGAATDTTALWGDMLMGKVNHVDYIDEKVVLNNWGYNYLESVDGFYDHVQACLQGSHTGKGLAIHTASEETGEDTVTYVDPTVFLQLGAFETLTIAADPKTHAPARKVSGAATGIVNDIHDAFHKWTSTEFWQRKGASSAVHGINSRLRNSMLGWIGVNSKQSTMMNAKGVLGRIARIDASAGVAGKVCTGIGAQYAHHVVTDKNGTAVGKLPVAIIHPDCLLAKGLKHGDIIGVGRTPTVSLAFCVVKFSRTYGRMGYIHMGFDVWAQGNNGDTDGDPCNRIRVGGINGKGVWVGATYRQALKLNTQALGMGGYDVVCGAEPSKHDCADFVNFKACWTKKLFNNSAECIPTAIRLWAQELKVTIKGLEPLVNLMLPATLLDSAKKVSQHYRANVGVAYGWCSAYSAHMKEKHSFLEAVVTHLLNSDVAKSYGTEAPTVDEMMEILIAGDMHAALEEENPELQAAMHDKITAVCSKYPVIVALYQYKAAPTTTNPMNLAEMGQHIKVMLEASAWLWRGVYEGLGLSGYSPDAYAFFTQFTDTLRNTAPGHAHEVTIGQWLVDNQGMSLEVANEIFAACLLYNGYRAIERGQHLRGDNPEQATVLENYAEMYNHTMSAWADTKADEYESHAVLAGVFRRAGQGTSGVSLDDEMSSTTSAQMIFSYGQNLWADKLAEGKAVFRNLMLNDIVTKSISLYNQLVDIAGIEQNYQ
jgi:hypothetical protein